MGEYLGQKVATVYDMLEIVRERPAMWIGNAELERLHVWIQGFRTGTQIAGDPVSVGEPDFDEFHGWVAARLGVASSGKGWARMLLESVSGDQERAFGKFWIELDAFRASRAVVH
jgi:hypothetical protein